MKLWRTRILAKRLLSRLPVSYRHWAALGLFRHGRNDDPQYSWNVMERHAAYLPPSGRKWRGLELGPGDGLLTAFVAPAFKAASVTLIDAGAFAHCDARRYREALRILAKRHPERELPHFSEDVDVPAMLSAVSGAYHTAGVESLRALASSSVDLIWSQAVLEHVRLGEYCDLAKELRRIIAPDGVMSHVIDFKDHLGGGLNNLRFCAERWEADGFAHRSGFYTNRIRLSQTAEIFTSVGFNVEIISAKRWKRSPISRRTLAPEFKALSEDDLLVSEAHLLMRPR